MFHQLNFKQPIIRINNREENITFFSETLGFRLKSEENSIAEFTDFGQGRSFFTIEESPANRTRACQGPKKLAKTIIRTKEPDEILQLLVRNNNISQVFKGEKGFAFECISPDNDIFLLHAEDNLDNLEACAFPKDIKKRDNFKGLTEFVISEIILNVLDRDKSKQFYHKFLSEELSTLIRLQKASGDDLEVSASETWDLEILEFEVGSDTDLLSIKTELAKDYSVVYLDKKERLMVVTDPSGIELWFQKK